MCHLTAKKKMAYDFLRMLVAFRVEQETLKKKKREKKTLSRMYFHSGEQTLEK